MPVITLPDGSQTHLCRTLSIEKVAADIGPGLAKAALAGKVDGKLVDTSYVIDRDVRLAIVTDRDPEGLEVIRHSTAHLLAQAVKQLFPDAQVTIGPVIEDGFYYDFAYKRTFTPEDLVAIEERMRDLAEGGSQGHAASHAPRRCGQVLPGSGRGLQGRNHRQHSRRPRKSACTVSRTGSTCAAARTCRAPASCSAFKLMKIAGAYWRGDSRNEMLQRIYGTAWPRRQAAEGVSDAAGRGGKARPPQARQGTGPVPLPGGGAGRRLLAPEGLDHVPGADRVHAREAAGSRLPGSERAGNHGRRAVAALRPPGKVRREHVPDRRRRTSGLTRSSR